MRLQGDELTLKAAVNAYKVTLHAVTSNHENWHLKYDPDFEHTKLDPYMSPNNRKKLFLAFPLDIVQASVHFQIIHDH